MKVANEQERHNLINDLLPEVFDDWTTSLLRTHTNAFLKRSEVVCACNLKT
jgi:hypothetical protein